MPGAASATLYEKREELALIVRHAPRERIVDLLTRLFERARPAVETLLLRRVLRFHSAAPAMPELARQMLMVVSFDLCLHPHPPRLPDPCNVSVALVHEGRGTPLVLQLRIDQVSFWTIWGQAGEIVFFLDYPKLCRLAVLGTSRPRAARGLHRLVDSPPVAPATRMVRAGSLSLLG